jgi:hypothetical protein
VVQRRCVWNSDTGKYDRDCTSSLVGDARQDRNGTPPDGGTLGAPDVPCGPVALCLQSCGCHAGCVAGCPLPTWDAALTTYYANDPRYQTPTCSLCQGGLLGSCTRQRCAAECDRADAGP